MKKIFLLGLPAVFCFLSGCIIYVPDSSVIALSQEKPFCDLVDKELKLLRPLKVCSDISWDDLDEKEQDSVIAYGEIGKITFTDIDGTVTVKEYCKEPVQLTAGTIIKFDKDSFWLKKTYDFFVPYKIRYYASFRVINNPDISSNWKFRYIWGRGLYLNRAPWEDNSVPESRYIGFNGTSYSGE